MTKGKQKRLQALCDILLNADAGGGVIELQDSDAPNLILVAESLGNRYVLNRRELLKHAKYATCLDEKSDKA